MSDFHYLGFTPSFLEACTVLKLEDLLQDILRERPDDYRELQAVSEELAKRARKVQEGQLIDHPEDVPASFRLPFIHDPDLDEDGRRRAGTSNDVPTS